MDHLGREGKNAAVVDGDKVLVHDAARAGAVGVGDAPVEVGDQHGRVGGVRVVDGVAPGLVAGGVGGDYPAVFGGC